MASMTITIPDSVAQRVYDAFASTYRYKSTLPDGSPNPQTEGQFAKQRVIAYMKGVVVNYESNQAAIAAGESAATTANTDITLT